MYLFEVSIGPSLKKEKVQHVRKR